MTPEEACNPDDLGPEPDPEPRRQVIPDAISNLASLGYSPLLITGLLRDHVITRFASPAQIEEPDLRPFVWRDSVATGILVESIHRWRGELTEKRPAVIIKRNQMQNQRVGIADRAHTDGRGNQTYTTFWVGSHTLFCLHGTGAGAELLATEVQRQVTRFAPVLTECLGLYRCQVTEVGAVQEIEEAKEGFAVPVTCGWAYHESWVLLHEALPLRKISLSTLLDQEPFQGDEPPV